MNRDLEAGVLLVIGVIVGRLAYDGGYLSYVKPGLFWPLILACGVLVVVGAASLWLAYRRDRNPPPSHDHDHGLDLSAPDAHGHGHGSARIGLLLLAPIVVLVLVSPAPLGSFAADRASANQFGDLEAAYGYAPLPEPVDGAVNLTLTDVLIRSLLGGEAAIGEVPVRLTGFVVPDDRVDGAYRLTRFVVGCCAADARPVQVLVTGAGQVPREDTWLEVVAVPTGEIDERDDVRLPVLELQEQQVVEEPAEPYEY